jgi:FkbM family methyltransferase
MKFSHRFQFLVHHSAFKKKPLLVSCRLIIWLLCKKFGFAQTVNIHRSSRMRLYPLKNGMGASGLIYVFRDDFEEIISLCIRTFVKEGSICFDIGTNIGIWSLLMSETCAGTGHVYSVEPASSTRKNLCENIELSKKSNITVLPTALGEVKGEANFYTPADPGRASLAPEASDDDVQKVPVNRLDEVWEELGRPQISFVKMDVEGAEPLVLSGGSLFFKECRPVVTSEINPVKLSNLGKKPEDIFKFFRDRDYDMFTFNGDTARLTQIDYCDDGDVVFIPKDSKTQIGAQPC